MLDQLGRGDDAMLAVDRYRFLSAILESFTATLDLREVVRRMVTITREEFRADRAWLIRPVTEEAEFAKVIFSSNGPDCPETDDTGPVPLANSRNLIRRALTTGRPVAVIESDDDLDPDAVTRFSVRSELVQILRPAGDPPWAFGLHQCSSPRIWTAEEIDLFSEVGRYATIALNNTLIHERAVREIAKINAILDQIPESAAIYDANGRLERLNAAAQKDPRISHSPDPEGRIRSNAHRYVDGSPLGPDELPSIRALRGEIVKSDYLIRDPRSDGERVVNFKAAPIRDDKNRIIGSVVLSRDVTEDREDAEREGWRRRRAECLANLGLETLTVQPAFDNLDEPAARVAKAIDGIVQIYLYRPQSGVLELVGWSAQEPGLDWIKRYLAAHPYKPGEGLAGTVFQIGRPLLFYEIRGNAVIDFARDDQERKVKAAMHQQSLIACPIESYGERIGALILSQADTRRNFDAEDLEFAQAVAERIGATSHIHRLTRVSHEGHRAAEELARQEVDARVRFEAVLETAPIGIAVLSADELRFDLANARFLDFAAHYGRISSETKVIGLRGNEVIPGLESLLRKVAETGEPRVDEAIEVKGRTGPVYVNRIISAVGGRFSGVTQSVTVLVQDVTEQLVEERQNREKEALRRRRAECLASLGLEKVTVEATFDDLNETATRIAQAVSGSVMIYMYHRQSSELHVAGFAASGPTAPAFERFRNYVQRNPYHAGEGLPGTAFQIGRPLFYSDVTGDAVIDFGRSMAEKFMISSLKEESVIACAIESYGDRIGAIVISRSAATANFTAEDLEFAQSAADRIGAASHIQRLTRISQEGHRAAEELARREVDARVRFEAVLETAPVGIAVFSADELRFDLANARFMDFAAIYGKISPSDTKVIGLRAEEVIPGFERLLKSVAETGEARVDEAFEIARPGNRLYINRIISPVRGRFSGITQSLTVLIQDVTDQVRAKREIEDLAKMMAERSARLDSILGSMTDALWVFDAKGNVVDVNQSALTMFGLGSRTEAVDNKSFARFSMRYPDGRPIPPQDLPQSRALRGQTVPDYLTIGKHVLTSKDLDLSIAAAPIESNGIVGAVLVIRDITGLQELDRKKDEFLSVASHELRTPLTTIKGYTQLLAQTVNELPPEERATYINAVLGEIDRMMGLISELLDVSRIETNRLQIHPQQIRWVEFLERRALAFRVQNPSRMINFAAETTETIVEADPDRMRQVIDNLLSNAIKYSPEGSEIDVRILSIEGMLRTSVIDRGIGIPSDEIPRLFERFHRARNVSSRYYGGLGLGLYIARAIVEAHRGRITVESEEGKGSVFSVLIPQA
jgi:PAS domain S-box-containing protein